MAVHNICNTDRMAGTDNRAFIRSGRYYSALTPSKTRASIDNGMIVKIGSLENGEREIYEVTTPAITDSLDVLGLVATPEEMYDERKYNLSEYTNELGEVLRIYKLHKGDVFSVTDSCFTSAPVVGNIVELKAANPCKMYPVSTATTNSTKIGEIIDTFTAGGRTYYTVEVK